MNEELKPKHEAILRKAAEVVRARGHEGDAKLADSINGVIASLLASRTPTVTNASAAAAAPGASIDTPDLTEAVTAKLAEFYPQSTPFDMEKNQRLARAILRMPLLRAQLALAGQCGARQEPVYQAHIHGDDWKDIPAKDVDGFKRAKFNVRALYAAPVSAQGAQPEHETIVREGDKLVCTTCGTSAGAQQGDVRAAVLEEAAKLVIKFTAVPRDVLGPATVHMKTLAAVGKKIADAIRALAAAPAQAQRGTPKQHAALQKLADIAQANDMGYGAPAQAQDGGPTCTKFEPEGAQAATHAKGGDE